MQTKKITRTTLAAGAALWGAAAVAADRPAVDKAALDKAFEKLNTFTWGDPGTDQAAGGTIANINSGQFGRITTQAGTPRIIQLGMKYMF